MTALRNRLRALALVGAASLGGCAEAPTDGALEVAAELRALRTAMLATTREPAARSIDGGQVREALAPLREVLDGLARQQQDLHERQLALAQELQRWSQLVTQSVTGQAKADGDALAARLAQLEAALQSQDARHKEVEALLGGALDRTADRLDDFLKRLADPTAAPGPPPTPESSKPPETGAGRGNAPAPGPAGGASEPLPDAVSRRQASSAATGAARQKGQAWWWVALLAAACSVAAGFAWQLRRSSVRRAPAPGFAAPVAAEIDRGAEEIWAAAALLGEAVGRLKQTAELPAAEVVPDADLALDDVFVLDDDLLTEAPLEQASELPPRAAAAVPGLRPRTVLCHLPTVEPRRAMIQVRQVLDADTRVLRRPEPTVVVSGNGLNVSFAVLPTLLDGERSHLEQLLREAIA